MSRKTRIAILTAIGGLMSWTLLSVLLLLYGNDWWLSGLTTLTVLAWLAGLLVVMYQPGPIRAAATGAVIASAVYWMLTLGPWFSTNVGPTLLTSRLLAHAEPLLRGNVVQTQVVTWATTSSSPMYTTGSPYALTGSGIVSGQIAVSPPTTAIIAAPTAFAGSIFRQLGHWLFIWLIATVGGCAAFLMQWRYSQKQRATAATPPGASP